MTNADLFHGIAFIIDDQIGPANQDAVIRSISDQIKGFGCHVVEMTQLPIPDQIKNMKSASFFILDWNLNGAGELTDTAGVKIPASAAKANIKASTDFIRALQDVRLAPIFIFTNEDVEAVKAALRKAGLFSDDESHHIFVKSKNEVREAGVFNVLSDWISTVPSALVLKQWEAEYEKAKNALFLDFYNNSPAWPLIVWNNSKADGVSPSFELGNLISRNLVSRMAPFEFNFSGFEALLQGLADNAQAYQTAIIKVLEGERFLPKVRLHPGVATGDIFKEGKKYFINVRPDCDCVPRNGEEVDQTIMYLLAGRKLTEREVQDKINPLYGQISEGDQEAVIFAMEDGKSFMFRFQEMSLRTWGELKEKRIGRLLPPFMTRLQQRYAAYLQRPGLPRIPKELTPAPVNPASTPASDQVAGAAEQAAGAAEQSASG